MSHLFMQYYCIFNIDKIFKYLNNLLFIKIIIINNNKEINNN